MKTEQEQIEAIKQIIDERVETTLGQVQGRHDNVIKTVDTIIIARDIVEAGYGNVSEYKAEIERLETDFITLECNYDKIYDEHKEHKIENENLKILNNKFRECIDYLKAEVKQAQIDVLNKLKERAIGYTFLGEKLATETDIDELIKEVENE